MSHDGEERGRRLFFAFWPSDTLRDQLERTAPSLLAQRGGRAVPARNLHVTLLFLGQVQSDQFESVRLAGDRIAAAPFDLTFDQVEIWGRSHVVCLTSSQQPAEPRALHGQLTRALSQQFEFREFREQDYQPHITLARDAPRRGRPASIEPIHWSVRDFVLVESTMTKTGSEYLVLERWALKDEETG